MRFEPFETLRRGDKGIEMDKYFKIFMAALVITLFIGDFALSQIIP